MRYLFVLMLISACAAAPNMDDIEAAGNAEASAYATMLHGKVDRGEMTNDEARYLYQQKVNELTQRYEATQRARTQRQTRCRPDGLGGVICR